MSLVKWTSPSFFPRLNSLWEDFPSTETIKFFNQGTTVPAVNVSETDNSFTLELAAPGKSKEDFKVEINGGVLSIGSQEEDEKIVDEKNYTRKEYSFSSFSRSFTLPENAEGDKIDASYKNGVLMINIPKKEIKKSNSKVVAIS